MNSARKLLITGATGKQGGAVIDALLSHPSGHLYEIYALTRSKTSLKAQALASNPKVSLIQGNLDDCTAIFSQISKPWGVFSVQLPIPNAKVEERRGKALADAAAAAGVKHFVYTSADRGGTARSDGDPTKIAHVISKYNIEKHIQQMAAVTSHKMDWTVLRPVAFMENLTPNFFGKAFATMWRLNGVDRRLQLIATKDVGRVAAEVFVNPEQYRGKAISLAGDDLSPREANLIFKQQIGYDMPLTYNFMAQGLKSVFHKQLGSMFERFKEVGFGADVEKLRQEYPDMQRFGTWLKESSGFR